MLYPTVQLCYCMELCHHLPDTNAMLLPRRVPGYKDSDVKLLSSSTTKRSVVAHFTVDSIFSPPPPAAQRPSNNTPIHAHYSFDMAQQVFYPNDPLQPGPMYFLTPCKCASFSVCCESIPWQVNYLIDEAIDMGKGSNAIVSMLHHFFAHHGLGEKTVYLHADNCGGQNKNATMVQYLLWRVTTGLHTEITLSFMIPGHTKPRLVFWASKNDVPADKGGRTH